MVWKNRRKVKMVGSRISILVGRNDEEALELGRTLKDGGADVMFSRSSPLQIQYEVLNKKPDALILSCETKHTAELCGLLKKTKNAPYIVVVSQGDVNESSESYRACADLIVDSTKMLRTGELKSRILGSRKHAAIVGMPDRDQFIADALFELCITKKYSGYRYILEAIKLASQSGPISRCISKDIYPEIAARFGVAAYSVERNIRTVIRSSWTKSSLQIKREYFGPFTLDSSWTPTNSEFIFIVADRLALKSGGHL